MTTTQLPLICGLLAAATLTLGCSDDSGPESTPGPDNEELLAPPAAGEGFQYKMVTAIEPGAEVEHCQFVKAPEEGMHVWKSTSRFSAGSHHFLLYETAYTEEPTEKDDGSPIPWLDTPGVFDCSEGAFDGFSITGGLGGSQNPKGNDDIDGFPPGVARSVEPGTYLLMNAHYINTTAEVIEPQVVVNLYTRPGSEVEVQGGGFFYYNIFIKAAAQSTGRARMRCNVTEDVTLLNASSHMHKRGTGFQAVDDAGFMFFETDKWEDVPIDQWKGGIEVKAGTVIDYYCDYENNEMHDVYQGSKTTDEMCMFTGDFYPADAMTSGCGWDSPVGEIGQLGADWVGNGTTSCAASMACMSGAAAGGLEGITDCVDASDPAVAAELSDATRCFLLQSFINGDPLEACAAEIEACSVL